MADLELDDHPMSVDQAIDQLYYWGAQHLDLRDRAFDSLLGWIGGRAMEDPEAANLLRLIRDRAERT